MMAESTLLTAHNSITWIGLVACPDHRSTHYIFPFDAQAPACCPALDMTQVGITTKIHNIAHLQYILD